MIETIRQTEWPFFCSRARKFIGLGIVRAWQSLGYYVTRDIDTARGGARWTNSSIPLFPSAGEGKTCEQAEKRARSSGLVCLLFFAAITKFSKILLVAVSLYRSLYEKKMRKRHQRTNSRAKMIIFRLIEFAAWVASIVLHATIKLLEGWLRLIIRRFISDEMNFRD